MNPLLPLVTQTRTAQRQLARASAEQRSKALAHLADIERMKTNIEANQRDLDRALETQTSQPFSHAFAWCIIKWPL